MRQNKATLFYFLQPDKNKNLILRGKESPPTSTNRYIVEEYYPGVKTSKSIITPIWTRSGKTYIWKSMKNNHNDRKERISNIIIKTFGYNDKTFPTLDDIIQASRGDIQNNYDIPPDSIWQEDTEYSTEPIITHLRRKDFIPIIQNERLLTAGQPEENILPAARDKILKSEVKEKLSKIKKMRCK